MPGTHKNFRIVPIRPDDGSNTEVYARVYDNGEIQIVGRNVKLDIKQAAYGKGKSERWAFGDNWRLTSAPWEASADASESEFTPEPGE